MALVSFYVVTFEDFPLFFSFDPTKRGRWVGGGLKRGGCRGMEGGHGTGYLYYAGWIEEIVSWEGRLDGVSPSSHMS